MNGRIVAAVCNRHALLNFWPGGCNPPPRVSSTWLRTGETPNATQERTKETKEFLTADYADDADVLRKETALPSVLSASSAVKKSKFRTPVGLTSNNF